MSEQNKKAIRVGGASGYWGESDLGARQLLDRTDLDYVVFDYLAEITMSIMARARAADPTKGYATDFVSSVIKPNLSKIASSGVKIISNAGGVNPIACGEAIRKIIAAEELDLKVAVITGDDLIEQIAAHTDRAEMFSGQSFPDLNKIVSANAYLGAFPIAEALKRGADIVVTGRCVDSAVTLGACIHAFGWERDEWNKLAGASLAGHIVECGPQATGGNLTDWEDIASSLDEVGYPIAEIDSSGNFTVTKPEDTGGAVTVNSVGEQMLYEIGDPEAYILPDVICDFSHVQLQQIGPNIVSVTDTRGHPAPDSYKVSLTWNDGWRAGSLWFFVGEQAAEKANSFGNSAISRTRKKLRSINAPDFDEVLVEVLGDESHYGAFAKQNDAREVTVKIAAKHQDAKAVGALLKETTGLALAAPSGLTLFSGGRPKPSPVVRLFSFLVPKSELSIAINLDGEETQLSPESGAKKDVTARSRIVPPEPEDVQTVDVPLIKLAHARSGDKGNKANIGILPRDPKFTPWIWASLSEDTVSERFAHFLNGSVERYYLPGTGAINFLLHDVLGGGGIASLRNDPQGKTFAQVLLQTPISIPQKIAEAI